MALFHSQARCHMIKFFFKSLSNQDPHLMVWLKYILEVVVAAVVFEVNVVVVEKVFWNIKLLNQHQ